MPPILYLKITIPMKKTVKKAKWQKTIKSKIPKKSEIKAHPNDGF